MDIINKFTRTDDTTSGIIKYDLNASERTNLLSSIPQNFRECYISKSDLKKLCRAHGMTSKEILEQFKLPDDGKIMSGDFGEILCLLVIKSKLQMKGLRVFGIPKWRWKQEKNKAAPHSDGILFHQKNSKVPSTDDFVVSVESKMKAVKNNNYRPIQNAIDGAQKDKLTRLAKTIVWLDQRFGLEPRPHLLKKLERFKRPDVHGTYKKHFKAIALIDSNFFDDELNAGWSNTDKDIQVIAFSISDLKGAYNGMFKSIANLS